MIITLSETHVHGLGGAHSVYYHWTLKSKHHLWFTRISGRTYYKLYWRYGNHASEVKDIGTKISESPRIGESRFIRETEFVM